MQFNFKMKSLDIDYTVGAKPTLTSNIERTLKSDDLAIEFSNKVQEILVGKITSHNLTNDVEVSLDQVTKIFKDSFANFLKPSFALADVNIFLNMATAGNVDMGDHFEPSIEEMKEAERETKGHGLENYDFRNVDDLYLQTEEETKAEAYTWLASVT
tara:strand:- start:4864 stop:5334 length:471 start_codon:yes stop_codon:yes gene_type:complete